MTSPIFVATLNGLVDLNEPDPKLITCEAIAHGLAKINRWAGATILPFTDAQHSQLVAEIFRQLRPGLAPWSIYALLHDAHEYLLGDILAPTEKRLALLLPGLREHMDNEKLRIDGAIRSALGVPSPPNPQLMIEIAAAVRDADLCAYDVEWRSAMPTTNGMSPYRDHARRHGWGSVTRKPKPWVVAHDDFLAELLRVVEDQPWEVAA